MRLSIKTNKELKNILRRIDMNVLKVTLIVVALLSIAILTGCQEGYSHDRGMSKVDRVAYQPTGTGFWHPTP